MAKKENQNVMNNNTVNILTAGTKLKGDIAVSTDFRLDGEIEGNVESKSKIVIGENGLLKGTLHCVNAEVFGKVVGNIVTSDCLVLRSTAKISGDIKVKSLVVESGAQFEGGCSMAKMEQILEKK